MVSRESDMRPIPVTINEDSWTFDWDSVTVPDGPHAITAEVTDNSGNKGTAICNVDVKNYVPEAADVVVTVYNPKVKVIVEEIVEEGENGR